MPRIIWIDYQFFTDKCKITQTRCTFNLSALPLTQHNRIWPLFLKLICSYDLPSGCTGRYLKVIKSEWGKRLILMFFFFLFSFIQRILQPITLVQRSHWTLPLPPWDLHCSEGQSTLHSCRAGLWHHFMTPRWIFYAQQRSRVHIMPHKTEDHHARRIYMYAAPTYLSQCPNTHFNNNLWSSFHFFVWHDAMQRPHCKDLTMACTE